VAAAPGERGVCMRRAGGITGGWYRWPSLWAWTALAGATVGVLALSPAGHGAARLAARLAVAAATLSRQAPLVQPARVSGRPFEGTPAAGALFQVTPSGLGRHFCTATVVASPVKDLVITAAHCVYGRRPGQLAFVPGYRNGSRPYGTWIVRNIVVDSGWRASANPNRDVAFLVVGQPGQPGVQRLTGGERLGTGWPARTWVHVIGYPDGAQWPVICRNRTHPFGRNQLRFDCGGYPDGTSGGPFLARWHAATGSGTVIGVIGGYQQGGYLESVSYSPRFGHPIRSLYRAAVAVARQAG
jgi:V8-like Glu-specific endopeptidase